MLITLVVEDLEAAKTFYQEVFGLPILFEDANSAVFEFGSTLVNLLKAEAAVRLAHPHRWRIARPACAFS